MSNHHERFETTFLIDGFGSDARVTGDVLAYLIRRGSSLGIYVHEAKIQLGGIGLVADYVADVNPDLKNAIATLGIELPVVMRAAKYRYGA